MIISVAGDIHGAIDRLYAEVAEFERALGVQFAWVLQVGDFGVWPALGARPDRSAPLPRRLGRHSVRPQGERHGGARGRRCQALESGRSSSLGPVMPEPRRLGTGDISAEPKGPEHE